MIQIYNIKSSIPETSKFVIFYSFEEHFKQLSISYDGVMLFGHVRKKTEWSKKKKRMEKKSSSVGNERT